MKTRMLALAGVLLAAAPAAAQRTISPGMSEAQVRAVLGTPATTRATDGWKYLYYHNGCPVRCGSDDVVFLQNDRVVAAVFRTGARRFTGAAPDEALQAAGGDEPTAVIRERAEPAVVGGVRVRTDDAEGPLAPRSTRPRQDAEGRTVIIRTEGEDPGAPRPLRRAGSRETARDTTRPLTPSERDSLPGITTGSDTGRVITPTGIPPRSQRDTARRP